MDALCNIHLPHLSKCILILLLYIFQLIPFTAHDYLMLHLFRLSLALEFPLLVLELYPLHLLLTLQLLQLHLLLTELNFYLHFLNRSPLLLQCRVSLQVLLLLLVGWLLHYAYWRYTCMASIFLPDE